MARAQVLRNDRVRAHRQRDLSSNATDSDVTTQGDENYRHVPADGLLFHCHWIGWRGVSLPDVN